MVFMRFYSVWNFVSIFLLSLSVYYAFMWIANLVSFSWTYLTIMELHLTPLYYLTVLLCAGACFVADLFITGYQFNFLTTPTDFLRSVVN